MGAVNDILLMLQEIFELMTPEAVRMLISKRPGNLQTLVTQAVAQLYQVVETVSWRVRVFDALSSRLKYACLILDHWTNATSYISSFPK